MYENIKKVNNKLMMKRVLKKIIYILFLINFIFMFNKVEASIKKEGIENFPESYRPYLEELKKKYPNWNFTALYTGLDWNYVISEENKFGKNLVPLSYSDRWKNTNPGEYNVEVDAGWVDSSKQAVQYTMDPRNFLNEVRIFQFETLSYDEKTNTVDTIEKILYGTEFYQTIVGYYTSSGDYITTNLKYSDAILNAAKTSRVGALHLSARIKQEVGPFLSHASISGTVEGFKGLYNFYNIGATSSSEPMGAIKNGLQYAKDGRGASEEKKQRYLIPWNTKEKAITGGGIFIGESYINVGQNTIYLQKFDVNDDRGGTLFTHQYMTNVLAPYSESKSTYQGYQKGNILNSSISFLIPVYENMPEVMIESPNINPNDYTTDNTKVYANVTTSLNVRSGPSTSYEVLTTVSKNEKMTRIAKGKQSGELWDKVKLENGMIGYVFQSYLSEVPDVPVTEIKLSLEKNRIGKNERVKISAEVLPENATNKDLEYSSDNTAVAIVNEDGEVLGVGPGKATITVKSKEYDISSSVDIEVYVSLEEIKLDTESLILLRESEYIVAPRLLPENTTERELEYVSENSDIVEIDVNGKIYAKSVGKTNIIVKSKTSNIQAKMEVNVVEGLDEGDIDFGDLEVKNNYISGLDNKSHKVEDIKNNINSIYRIEIYTKENKIMLDTEEVGTGCKLKVLDDNDEIEMEYTIIYYGDVNGDGKINSIDLLVLQRDILQIEILSNVYKISGDVRKTGKNPTSVDCLLIQRHILGFKEIEQK